MAMEDDFDEDGNATMPRGFGKKPNPIFYIVVGIVIGFVISMLFSPGFFPGFGEISEYEGTITQVNTFISQDLRAQKVILRIDDTNTATCIDGDSCLGYAEGDNVKVTCIGKECQATKK